MITEKQYALLEKLRASTKELQENYARQITLLDSMYVAACLKTVVPETGGKASYYNLMPAIPRKQKEVIIAYKDVRRPLTKEERDVLDALDAIPYPKAPRR